MIVSAVFEDEKHLVLKHPYVGNMQWMWKVQVMIMHPSFSSVSKDSSKKADSHSFDSNKTLLDFVWAGSDVGLSHTTYADDKRARDVYVYWRTFPLFDDRADPMHDNLFDETPIA